MTYSPQRRQRIQDPDTERTCNWESDTEDTPEADNGVLGWGLGLVNENTGTWGKTGLWALDADTDNYCPIGRMID